MNTIEFALAAVLWSSLSLVAYAYVGYPVLIWLASRWFGREGTPPIASANRQPPFVTLLIAAHNEEADIGSRIRNALVADYPSDRLEIVIASDGSTDGTVAIARSIQCPVVQVLAFDRRRGKPASLKAALPSCSGEILVLSDANTYLEPDAIRSLVRWFDDSRIGVVCGRLKLMDAVAGTNVDSLYWRYETFLKRCEARLGALLGANGAIYAIRKELFPSIPNETAVEDFVIPLQAKLNSGCEIVYDADAIANEETPTLIAAEFRRRARIGAGGFQSLSLLWRLLSPGNGWTAFSFLSHKLLRWLCPFFLLAALLANASLAAQSPYRKLLAAQSTFYLMALAGVWLPGPTRPMRWVRLSTMFVGMNAALLVGFWRHIRSSQSAAWERTERSNMGQVLVEALS